MRLFLFATLVVACTACGPRELRVTMNSDNNSGQTGFAVLTDQGTAGFKVYVETSKPEYAAESQLAHIHPGSCGELGDVKAGLLPLSASGCPERFCSSSDIKPAVMKFSDLSTGDWVINVHDARDKLIYVSCGVIPKP